jgi:hypothetical protein
LLLIAEKAEAGEAELMEYALAVAVRVLTISFLKILFRTSSPLAPEPT